MLNHGHAYYIICLPFMFESLFIPRAIKNITLLRTFDANGNIDEFKGVAKNEFGDLMCLPGPGKNLISTLRFLLSIRLSVHYKCRCMWPQQICGLCAKLSYVFQLSHVD